MKGEHLIVDLFGVEETQCTDVKLFIKLGRHIADLLEATVIKIMSKHFDEPNPGISVILSLNKSHISFHSIARNHVVAVDVFCCSTEGMEPSVLSILTDNISYSSLRKWCITRM